MSLAQSWTELPRRNRILTLLLLGAGPVLFAGTAIAKNEFLKHSTIMYEQHVDACLPWDYYQATFPVGAIQSGDIVAFHPHGNQLFHDTDTIVKLVAGGEGDIVDIHDGVLTINGKVLGDVRRGVERLGKPMNFWDTHYVIGHNEFFMFGSEYRSYDSRYWGIIKRDQIVAKLNLLG